MLIKAISLLGSLAHGALGITWGAWNELEKIAHEELSDPHNQTVRYIVAAPPWSGQLALEKAFKQLDVSAFSPETAKMPLVDRQQWSILFDFFQEKLPEMDTFNYTLGQGFFTACNAMKYLLGQLERPPVVLMGSMLSIIGGVLAKCYEPPPHVVLLTTPDPGKWYDQFSSEVMKVVVGQFSIFQDEVSSMTQLAVFGMYRTFLGKCMGSYGSGDKQYCIGWHQRYEASIRKHFGPAGFSTFQMSSGWKALMKTFETAFPDAWSTCSQEFHQCNCPSGRVRYTALKVNSSQHWTELKNSTPIMCMPVVFGRNPWPGHKECQCLQEGSEEWTFCSAENEWCTCSSGRTRLGGQGEWHEYVRPVPFLCSILHIGIDPLKYHSKTCECNRRTGWTFCSKENQVCKCPNGRIRFGITQRHEYKASIVKDDLSSPVRCHNKIFGKDPMPFVKKTCQCYSEPVDVASLPEFPLEESTTSFVGLAAYQVKSIWKDIAMIAVLFSFLFSLPGITVTIGFFFLVREPRETFLQTAVKMCPCCEQWCHWCARRFSKVKQQ